jgi:hypothetical protein
MTEPMLDAKLTWDGVTFEEFERRFSKMIKTADEQIGQGEASHAMLFKWLDLTKEDLERTTHRISDTLADSWEWTFAKTTARGFFDPQGLTGTISINPTAEKPPRYWKEGDLNKPIDYGVIEFSRGGHHDAPRIVSGRFEDHFDHAFNEFVKVFGASFGVSLDTAPGALPI